MDSTTFRREAHALVDFIADYYDRLARNEFPVLSTVEPGYLQKLLPAECPQDPEPFEAVHKDLVDKIMPGVTHWQSPNFFAYFPANSSFPAMLGDMVSGMINCIGFNWVCSPACTELETIMLDWMARLIELPPKFLSSGSGGGVIQGTASEAVIVCMLAARKRVINRHKDMDAGHVNAKLVAYASSSAHSCVAKAAMVANVTLRTVETTDDYRMDTDKLAALIEDDRNKGLIPFFVAGTIGTTSSGAVDNLGAIGKIAENYELWFHVDAAWAGSAAVCPEYRHLLKGLDSATSYNFNMHKWLLTNFDCSLLWIDCRGDLLDAFSITPEYLRNKASESGLVTDYRDWQLPLGRRFRSLKMWFVMRCYGAAGLQKHIRKHIAQGELFESLVRKDDRFEMVVNRSLSLVCFRLVPPASKGLTLEQVNELNLKLEDLVNTRGIYIVHTSLSDKYVLRFAPGSPWTEDQHIHHAWALFQQAASELMAGL